jgi:membrane protein implicated in regulation of membrane protease activity
MRFGHVATFFHGGVLMAAAVYWVAVSTGWQRAGALLVCSAIAAVLATTFYVYRRDRRDDERV